MVHYATFVSLLLVVHFSGVHSIDAVKVHLPNTTATAQLLQPNLEELLGKSLVPVDSNTTPNPRPPVNPGLPHATTLDQCITQWRAYFKKKTGDPNELNCCSARRVCLCYKDLCLKNPKLKGCKGLNVNCKKQKSCEGVTATDRDCMNLKDRKATNSNVFNWLWILIILAVLMIIILCVAIWCVYCKKFSGKDTAKDRKHAHITFGPMNVESKVKWHGKKKTKGRSTSRNTKKGSRSRTKSKK